jgi:tetratricopeptide (TPR) repeat protein
MHGFRRHIAIGALILAMLATAALSAAAVDWTGCAIPIFGADKRAAIAACTSILNQTDLSDADRVRALLVRGRASHRQLDIDAAIRDFDAAIKLAPKDPEPLVRRASAAFYKDNYQEAYEFAQQALSLDAKNSEAYDTIGTIALVTRNYAMAKAAYDQAIEFNPGTLISRYHRFEVLRAVGAQREAIQELDDLLALNAAGLDTEFMDFRGTQVSYQTMARLQRATLFEVMGRFEDSLKALNDLVQTDPGAVSYGWRGWYYHNRSQFDLALADLDKALTYDPNLAVLYNLKGQVYLYTKEYELAVAAFTRSLDLKIDTPGSSYWSRSLALRALYHTDEAEKDAQTAVAVDRDFLFGKSKTLIKLGYLQPSTANTDVASAVHDAVHACMLDERCW